MLHQRKHFKHHLHNSMSNACVRDMSFYVVLCFVFNGSGICSRAIVFLLGSVSNVSDVRCNSIVFVMSCSVPSIVRSQIPEDAYSGHKDMASSADDAQISSSVQQVIR